MIQGPCCTDIHAKRINMDYTKLQGALAIQHIRELAQDGHIKEWREEHLQPSSMDLSISGEIYRMRGTFFPQKGESIRALLHKGMLFPASLSQPLELNGIYLVRLNEWLNLPENICAITNNKSSSGRINLQTRLIVNGSPGFDQIPHGYEGELWLEIIPKSFPVKLSYGERLNQMRFFASHSQLSREEYDQYHAQHGFLRDNVAGSLDLPPMITHPGITMTLDLSSEEIIGYKCTPTTTKVLDYSRRDHDPLEFFEPIYRPEDGQFIMKRDEFYILATKEALRVPVDFAAEMMSYDIGKGEFRSHYAGFIDPGWGCGQHAPISDVGTLVLEVFTHDQDFVLRDGQPICTMVYEKTSAPAEISYGDASLTSNYYRQSGPRLSKHFKQK